MRRASHYQIDNPRPDKSKSSSARTGAARAPSARRGRAPLLALLAVVIAASQAAVSFAWSGGGRATALAAAPSAAPAAERDFAAGFFSAALVQLASESVETYAGDCTTPKDDFTLGDTVCVKASVPFSFMLGRRNINIIGPANVVRASIGVSDQSLSQTLTFTIPATAQTMIGDESFDNNGTWRADLSTVTGSRRASVFFDVSGSTAAADLQAILGIDGAGTVQSGGPLAVSVYVFNVGPSAAENVVVTPPSHTGLSLQNFAPASGSDCGGPCTIASLGRRSFAKFVATYNVTAAEGSKIVARASVTSDTLDPRPTFDYRVDDENPAPPPNTNVHSITLAVTTGVDPTPSCTLACPADIVTTANTTENGQPGAFVKYSAASGSGDCGAVSSNPALDELTGTKFFPVGTHTVTSTSETGGGSCSFAVKVLDTPAPTISCPADQFATTPAGSDEANVAVGTPTFTASGGGTVVGERSDSTVAEPKALTDPYPVGITGILWTVTDGDGRTAICRQRVTVGAGSCAGDTEPPTVTAPPDVTIGTGTVNTGCAVNLDDELGQAEASDNCSVTVTVSGAPAGNNFAPGTYTLTYTATDGAGLTATDTQVVKVVDDTVPIIAAPDDATYACLSEVPAASPSQARGPVIGSDGQFVVDASGALVFSGAPFDNCGVPTVTVTESNNGGAGSAANPLVITRTFKAADAAGNSATAVQTITVADGSPPVIEAPADASYQCLAEVPAASPSQATASDNCSVTVAVAESNNGGAGSAASPLVVTRVFTATDGAGNQTSDTQTITVIDNTPPALSVPADVTVYLPLNTPDVSMNVTYPAATASDNCAGAVTIAYSKQSGTVFGVGTTVVTVTATDAVGNQTVKTFNVNVLYNFTGFFSPVENGPAFNLVKAGQSVPLKFSLSGNKGLDIRPAGSPTVIQISCNDGAPLNDVSEIYTVTAGSSGLTYDSLTDQYKYVWKTESGWAAGTCRQFVLRLNDGTAHSAYFKFK
ncbi:MAG TPA: PxKF domain-containing protein [Pyrinomonadaceae bacterium]|nr:PxKF domain-containing protein [Pyrinomonadaceae bacterium]